MNLHISSHSSPFSCVLPFAYKSLSVTYLMTKTSQDN
uniref:Uncharacterized protein n=1 Tax=Arundo donax TaxID=35708 RepID=A0A0A9B1U5_ARUDO